MSRHHANSCSVGQLLKAAFVVMLLMNTVAAQSRESTDGTTPLGIAPGSPAGSFALSGFDTINPYNGNLNFRLPILGIAGRGSAQVDMMLPINRRWNFRHSRFNEANYNHHPEYNWWRAIESRYSPGVLVGRIVGEGSCPPGGTTLSASLTRLTFTSADGTEYELIDQLTGGRISSNLCAGGGSGASRGTVFVTTDGSAATFVSNSTIRDEIVTSTIIYPSGSLMMRDGTQYVIEGGKVSLIRDRNGNTLDFDYDATHPFGKLIKVTDSLNREISIVYNATEGQYGLHDQIIYKGFGSTGNRIVRISYSSLVDALRSDQTIKTFGQLFGGEDLADHNPQVVSSVWLPDGIQRYKLLYNSYSELARVELPTGGAYEYDWGASLLNGDPRGIAIILTSLGDTEEYFPEIYRRVLAKRVYPGGGTGSTFESQVKFSQTEGQGTAASFTTIDNYDSSGNLLARRMHYFHGNPIPAHSSLLFEYPAWNHGKEYREEQFEMVGDTPVLKQRTENTWQPGASIPANASMLINARIREQVISLIDTGQVSKRTFSYDQFNNKIDTYEYNFGAPSAGPLVRRTHIDYANASNPVNGLDYTVPAIHIRSLPISQQVYDSDDTTLRAQTIYEYDNYKQTNPDAFHFFLTGRSDITGLDSSYTTTFYKRGNTTKTTRYLLDATGSPIASISIHAHYDVAGNVVKVLDARSTPTNLIETEIDFTDNFGTPDNDAQTPTQPSQLGTLKTYAFPTKVTNAQGHVAYTQYDYYLGIPVNQEDANLVVSRMEYGNGGLDLLDRPSRMIAAIDSGSMSQTRTSYNDAARTVTTQSDLETYDDNKLKSEKIYDGLGRSVETRQYENSTQYIAVRHVPFISVEDLQTETWMTASQSSNPFRPYLGEQPVWTTAFADALGRTTKVHTPDNAIVRTTYSGISVTVADQTGRRRKSVSDALGRLKEVYEAPNDAVNYNHLTSYEYDVLGNLRHVYQGPQTRTFTYDSLSRLVTAMNPESGTINYEYDANGNLTEKSDARGVVTTFAPYDSLNRPTTRSYSHGTPTVNYAYDAAGVENSKGRLTSISSSVSTYNYSSYDALGRVKTGNQTIGSQTYLMAYSYDLAGNVKSINYPSGNRVTYNYDAAGRLGDKDAQNLAFTGNLGGTQLNYSTGITYSAFGGLSQERFGTSTPIYHKLFYNIRGQLGEIRAGLTPNNTSWQLGAIINHYSNGYGCWGASCNAADNNGNLMRQDHWIQDGNDNVQAIFSQQYEYDQLNRLKRVYDGTTWQQAYTYDRYGNRSIDGGATWGQNINTMQAAVVPNTTTNRMYAPGETEANHPLINYDPAGNQTKDYYSDPVVDFDRTYDAENRLVSATTTASQTNEYSYDGDGRRVVRNVNGEVTWQVYGFGGELLAEYPANGPTASPQKEYGYRNGQLLVEVTASTGSWGSPPSFAPPNPLVAGVTEVKSLHITELRTAINALRGHLGLPAFSWQEAAGVGDWIKADPILEMRTALDQALGPPSPAYSSGLAQSLPIKKDHIQELRDRVLSAWGGGLPIQINWLVADHLGTPRMIIDKTGSLANVKRHDYLPFGEELYADQGQRTTALGYLPNPALGYNGDITRQKFTSYERDNETELDFAQARYYSSGQGRFTSVDPLIGSARQPNPQSWNRYSYVLNRPLSLIDPTGLVDCTPRTPCAEVSLEEANRSNGVGLIQETVNINISDQTPLETTTANVTPTIQLQQPHPPPTPTPSGAPLSDSGVSRLLPNFFGSGVGAQGGLVGGGKGLFGTRSAYVGSFISDPNAGLHTGTSSGGFFGPTHYSGGLFGGVGASMFAIFSNAANEAELTGSGQSFIVDIMGWGGELQLSTNRNGQLVYTLGVGPGVGVGGGVVSLPTQSSPGPRFLRRNP
jgi:RHS repeat-associated protein